MKFQKGLLKDIVEEAAVAETPARPAAGVVPPATPILGDVEKNRLFETLEEETGHERNYLKLLGLVAAGVVVIGAVVFYFSLPGVGDKVKAPKGLEDQVRDHLLIKEKRTPTDMTFYYCGKYYWAAVEVETRPDIPGAPINRVSRYRVAAIQADAEDWNITAVPVTGTDPDVPCG
jgi:hypothetical protein